LSALLQLCVVIASSSSSSSSSSSAPSKTLFSPLDRLCVSRSVLRRRLSRDAAAVALSSNIYRCQRPAQFPGNSGIGVFVNTEHRTSSSTVSPVIPPSSSSSSKHSPPVVPYSPIVSLTELCPANCASDIVTSAEESVERERRSG